METTLQVTKFAIPEIIFGTNTLDYVVPCAVRNGAKKVLLVSDPGLETAGWVDKILDILNKSGLNLAYFNAVTPNPRDFQVAQGADFYLREKADVIIALGGGSPMDLAKGIALVASNGGQISGYEGANKIEKPLPPMIFIPTTAGSGADISQFAIITDVQRQVKMAIVSRTLVPNISIIDPNLLQTKPKWLVIASAIDALSHAIEAYVSLLSSPFTEMHSLQAIELILTHLEEAVRTMSAQSLAKLSTASTSAGMAFSNASLGADHAIAHSLGGQYDVMHGLVHPALLPAVMRFNLPFCPKKMAMIGEIVTGKRAHSQEDTALNGILALEDFFQSLDIPTRLSSLIPDADSLQEVSKLAIQDACCLTNPRPLTQQDCLAICEEVW